MEVNWLAVAILQREHLLVRNLALATVSAEQARRKLREHVGHMQRFQERQPLPRTAKLRQSVHHGRAGPTREAQRSRREEGNLSVSQHREG